MSMFSVDINSANGLNYIRPKKGTKPKSAAAQVSINLTKNGSVFNDPNIFTAGAQATTQTSGVMNMRTSRRIAQAGVRGGSSIFDNKELNFISGGDSNSSTSSGVNSLMGTVDATLLAGEAVGGNDLGIGKDPSKGMAAAKDLKEQSSDLKSGIGDVENRGSQAQELGKQAKKLNKTIDKANQKYEENVARQSAQMREIELERKKQIDLMSNSAKAINDYTAQLEAEVASSDQNMDRIISLRSLINENRNTLTISGRQVNVLGRSSRAIATGMAKTAKTYAKTNKSYQKDMDKKQEKIAKTLEVAAKIGEISAIVETSGTIIESLGQLFKACAGIPYVGAVLAAAGAVMEPIGSTGKAVGQWGKTAAQVTQGVAYACAGNLQGAFMSAAAAVQSGMQATASTKQAIAGFENLDASLADVKADAAEANAKRAEEKAAKAEENAAKAEKKAENAQKKEVENGKAKETGNTNKTKDADGNEIEQKEYDYTEKTDKKASAANEKRTEAGEKRIEAAKKREEADKARLEANYREAKNEIEHSGLSAAEKKEALEKLEIEKIAAANGITQSYGGQLAKGAEVNADSTLLKGSNIDAAKKGEITKKANEVAKKKAEEVAKKQLENKSKSIVKTIFSQEGMAVVGQALTVAGSICALTQRDECGCGSGRVSDFKVSQRAQKIVAQTMNRMGYSSPVHFKVKKR